MPATSNLGAWQTEKSKPEYGEWLANSRRVRCAKTQGDKPDLTVSELLSAYLDFAKTYYRRDGELTSEYDCIRQAIKTLLRVCGHTPANEFGPLSLKAVQNEMIVARLRRHVINRHTERIKRAIKWGVANEMVQASVHHGLQTAGGRAGGPDGCGRPPRACLGLVFPCLA